MEAMPRPASPLISHDAVVEASLRIIDREGLDAFSLPRLARELNVAAPSLYHHFADRADILRTVARAIVLQTQLPDPARCASWVDWFVGISLAFRRAVLSHRNAAPILLEFMPRDLLVRNYEIGVQIRGQHPSGVLGLIDAAALDALELPAIEDGGGLVTLKGWTGPSERGIVIHPISSFGSATDTPLFDRLRSQAEKGILTLRVADVLPAKEAAEAHRRLAAGGVRGRLVLDFSQPL